MEPAETGQGLGAGQGRRTWSCLPSESYMGPPHPCSSRYPGLQNLGFPDRTPEEHPGSS